MARTAPKASHKTPAKAQRRKPAAPSRTFGVKTLSAGAAALGLGAALVALVLRGRRTNPAEHAAPDLAADRPAPGPHDRAPVAFRPDPTAIPTPEERESLRPATGHAPAFAADRGSSQAEPQDAA